MTLSLTAKIAPPGWRAPADDDIVIRHAGEELRLHLFRQPHDRPSRARVAFDGPLSFRILRAELLRRGQNGRDAQDGRGGLAARGAGGDGS